jgi:hypothetical protein
LVHTGKVVSTDVVELSRLDQLPDVITLQVLEIVVVRSTEIGAQTAVVASNDDTTLAGGNLGVDTVLDAEADLLDGVLQDGGVLVITDTAQVDDGVGGQDVLGAAGRVLGGTTGDELGVEVGQQVLVQGRVLLLGQDSVVGLEVILGQERLGANCLDIWGSAS